METSDIANVGRPQVSVDLRGFVVCFEKDERTVSTCAKADIDSICRFHEP
jgi:hypothetical protein